MDAIEAELQARVFGRGPLPPTTGVPGRDVASSDNLRANAQGGNTSGSDFAPAALPPQAQTRMDALIAKLAALFQNANITAALPAHNVETWWSQPIDLSGSILLPAAVTPYASVVNYTCETGTRVRIKGYGVNVVDPAYTYDGSIIWRIRKNGVNVLNLAGWSEQRGSLVQPRETFILLEAGDILSFQVSRAVAAVAAQTVQMCITGYTWKPRRDYEGYRSSINAQ